MSANAGRVINTPALIPINVVTAKPLSNPAPAAPMPMNPKAPVNGTRETKAVAKEVKIINNAFFIRSLREINLKPDSSRITICESTPVPIVAIIPAIDGRSRFHLISAAKPRIIINYEKEVAKSAKEIFIFLYITRIISETARIANNPAIKTAFVNSLPSKGDIVSNFTISSL